MYHSQKFLLIGGADVNLPDSQGHTALYLCAKQGQDEAVKVLLSAGADANYVCMQEGGFTPLIAAAANEHLQTVTILIKVCL